MNALLALALLVSHPAPKDDLSKNSVNPIKELSYYGHGETVKVTISGDHIVIDTGTFIGDGYRQPDGTIQMVWMTRDRGPYAVGKYTMNYEGVIEGHYWWNGGLTMHTQYSCYYPKKGIQP